MAKSKIEPEKTSGLMKALNDKYGKGSVIHGNDTEENLEIIDSGSIGLNQALQLGGYPLGKLIEIFGPESSGKSTLSLHAIANFQKAGKKVALIDGEQSFDRKYAKNLGVNIEDLYIVQPSCGEQGYQISIDMIKSGEFGLLVIDSHTSMIPKAIVDAQMGDATMAVQARMNSVALAKIHPLLKAHKCTMIAISQLRTNIGGYGDPNIPTGGQSYKFYTDIRIKVSKLLEKEDSTNRTTVEVTKNKCSIPFGKATFGIIWGEGVDRVGEIIDGSLKNGRIKQAGAWYEIISNVSVVAPNGQADTLEQPMKFQGGDKLRQFLLDNPEFLAEMEKEVLKKKDEKVAILAEENS